jgi:outer membrane lipoprotein-sorting protein
MNSQTRFSTCLLCLLLLTCAACASRPAGDNSAGGQAASSGSTGGGTPSAAAISENDKPVDAMTRAMRAQLDAKSYRAHVTSTTADGAATKMLIEYAAPDRYRMTGEAPGGEAGKNFKMEYVIVEGATYIKTPGGGWVKSPVDGGEMIKAFRDPKMLDELAKTADVKFIGPDTFEGAPMLVYQYTQTNPMGMKLKSTSRTWLSVADGLPRKTETEGEFDGKKTKTLITMTDYNADIKIESPIK